MIIDDQSRTLQPASRAHWFAINVRPRHEKSVAEALRRQGLEFFLPLYQQRHVWSDRIKRVELPLFAGYVFCRFSFADRMAVWNTQGVIRILGAGNVFAPLTEEQIAELRAVVMSGLPARPCPYLAPGEVVRVERGPLAGVRGTVIRNKGFTSVVVSVEMLQRSVEVEVESGAVCCGRHSGQLTLAAG